jgi:D-alanyl-lipoteichoic acid acyltransferase DltB (MBOAT superfamily)
MLFNSLGYILLFLPVTLIVYLLLNKQKLTLAAKAWLVFASLFFYSWWNIKYLALIVGSIFFNYALGTVLGRMNGSQASGLSRKSIVIVGVLANLALLGYYKYLNFFVETFNHLGEFQISLQKIVLPLGISFFTFTQIAYLVDAYHRKVTEYDFLNYSLFVTFFPHLLAGPIIHHQEMMPQFDSKRNKIVNYKHISHGLFLFFIGLFKKVVIADACAPVAQAGFDVATTLTLVEAWVTSLSYTLQLYFDFSAYTDMALGAALLFNIRLPRNFNSPYKAVDINDFWRRWHMTLSRFLKDYIYIPLGGNRKGEITTYQNVLITFLIGGIWHGAGWTFAFWGILHGTAAVMHRLWTKLNIRMNRALAWFITFNFVNIAWIFFRARTWDDALKVLKGMAGLSGIKLSPYAPHWHWLNEMGITSGRLFYMSVNRNIQYLILLLVIIVLAARNSDQMMWKFTPDWKTVSITAVIAMYSLWNMDSVSEFLYFNF